ncbi:MAG: glycosyltransferase [Polyangiaceae bacterium]|jgi:rhamnosyl/mannosyltransferase
MTMRIAHLGKFYPPATGGVEIHVQTLAQAQACLGADVRVICVNHRDALLNDVTWRALGSTPTIDEWDGNVRVTRVGRRASISRLDLCELLIPILAKLRWADIDVVHVHAPNPTMFCALAALPAFASLVVTHHSDIIKQRVLSQMFAPVEKIVHRRAALVLSDSEAYIAGSPVLRRLGAKVKSLPLGLNLGSFMSPTPAALAWEARLRSQVGSPLWLFVGRLVYYKGLSTAIDALAQVPGRLLVVGTGPLEQTLRARAIDRGVADRITWVGYADPDRLVGAYRAATALWFPSNARSEGYGLVQVEAMASGCPVINTAIPHSGVPWVSRNDETGLTVPVNDAEAFAAASRRLINDPGLRDRLGSAARRRAEEHFNHLVMGRRSLDLYAQVGGTLRAVFGEADRRRRASKAETREGAM